MFVLQIYFMTAFKEMPAISEQQLIRLSLKAASKWKAATSGLLTEKPKVAIFDNGRCQYLET